MRGWQTLVQCLSARWAVAVVPCCYRLAQLLQPRLQQPRQRLVPPLPAEPRVPRQPQQQQQLLHQVKLLLLGAALLQPLLQHPSLLAGQSHWRQQGLASRRGSWDNPPPRPATGLV